MDGRQEEAHKTNPPFLTNSKVLLKCGLMSCPNFVRKYLVPKMSLIREKNLNIYTFVKKMQCINFKKCSLLSKIAHKSSLELRDIFHSHYFSIMMPFD